ncbi:hypothetical protein EV363DRAFT_1452064 [Boletus edulis]|nr:hypothetical protein EV363DRAFT_1452064 [Boletus edulis]
MVSTRTSNKNAHPGLVDLEPQGSQHHAPPKSRRGTLPKKAKGISEIKALEKRLLTDQEQRSATARKPPSPVCHQSMGGLGNEVKEGNETGIEVRHEVRYEMRNEAGNEAGNEDGYGNKEGNENGYGNEEGNEDGYGNEEGNEEGYGNETRNVTRNEADDAAQEAVNKTRLDGGLEGTCAERMGGDDEDGEDGEMGDPRRRAGMCTANGSEHMDVPKERVSAQKRRTRDEDNGDQGTSRKVSKRWRGDDDEVAMQGKRVVSVISPIRPRGRTKSRPRPAEPSGSTSPSVKPKTPHRSSTKKKLQAAEPVPKAEIREAPKASQPKTPAATRRRRRSQSPESSNNPSTSLGNEEQPSAPKCPWRESKGLQPATPTIKSYLVESSTKGPKAHGTVKKMLVFDGVEILTKNPRPRILPTRSPAPGPSSSSDIYPPTTSATSGSSEVQRLAEECDRLRRDNMALENRVRLLESGLKTFGNVLKARFPDLNDARLAFPFADSSQTAESSNAGFAKTPPPASPVHSSSPTPRGTTTDVIHHRPIPQSPSPSPAALPENRFEELPDEDSAMEVTEQVADGIGAGESSTIADTVPATADGNATSAMETAEIAPRVGDAIGAGQTGRITEELAAAANSKAADEDSAMQTTEIANEIGVGDGAENLMGSIITGVAARAADDTTEIADRAMGRDGAETIADVTEQMATTNIADETIDGINAATIGDNTDTVATGDHSTDATTDIDEQAMHTIGDAVIAIRPAADTGDQEATQTDQAAEVGNTPQADANGNNNAGVSGESAALADNNMMVE